MEKYIAEFKEELIKNNLFQIYHYSSEYWRLQARLQKLVTEYTPAVEDISMKLKKAESELPQEEDKTKAARLLRTKLKNDIQEMRFALSSYDAKPSSIRAELKTVVDKIEDFNDVVNFLNSFEYKEVLKENGQVNLSASTGVLTSKETEESTKKI